MIAEPPASFGELLRRYRAAVGLTQEELAARTGLTPQAISLLECGQRRHPQAYTVSQLAEALALTAPERQVFTAVARHPLSSASAAAAVGSSILPAPGRAVHNLPVALTPLIGRAHEQAAVEHLLQREEVRLLTLTGPGGVGKTCLALQVAVEALSAYPAGVWLVELAALVDPGLVPQAVVQTLGLREEAGQSAPEILRTYLATRRLLLVLDNCEHLVGACAELAMALLRGCHRLHILATSREGLGVAGERLYVVPSLAVPPLDHVPAPDELGRYGAAALFVTRAQERWAAFALSARNAQAVAHVCARLDGLPLAIELAAARVGVLSVEGIAARLDAHLALLTGGPRTALPRQRTLRATLDWSYNLLNAPEQLLLQRLAIFAGGWTLDAAEAICTGEGLEGGAVLDVLTGLVNTSMVQWDETGGDAQAGRYRLLETVRQYAAERRGAATQVGEQHARYYLGLAEHAAPELEGVRQAVWLEHLQGEHANLRVALGWFVEQGAGERALRLASALWRFWWVRGHVSEGRAWLEAGLAQGAEVAVPVRLAALQAAGGLAMVQGDQPRALVLGEDLLALARAHGDPRKTKAALDILGMTAVQRGDQRQAEHYLEEALSLARALGQREDLAIALLDLGLARSEGGSYGAATTLIAEAQALSRGTGQAYWTTVAVGSLAYLALLQAHWRRAGTLLVEYVTFAQQQQDKANLAAGLEGLATLAAAEGRAQRATLLFAAAAAVRAEIGGHLMSRRNRTMIEQATRSSRDQLGEGAWLAAWDDGQAMTMEQALTYALEDPHSPTSPPCGSASVREPLEAPPWSAARPAQPSPSAGPGGATAAPSRGRLSRPERQAWALAHLCTAGPLSPRAYAQALKVSVDTALLDLRDLVDHRLVRAEGRTRNRRYILTGNDRDSPHRPFDSPKSPWPLTPSD